MCYLHQVIRGGQHAATRAAVLLQNIITLWVRTIPLPRLRQACHAYLSASTVRKVVTREIRAPHGLLNPKRDGSLDAILGWVDHAAVDDDIEELWIQCTCSHQ